MVSPITLNEKQHRVIDTLDEHILLLAAAGTGKTSVLTMRIAHILNQKLAKPSEILCLTFTNRACKEMKEKIASAAVSEGSGDVMVKTIHSYCYYLIKQFYKDADIGGDFYIYDEEDCLELIRDLSFTKLPGSAQSVLRFFYHIKEQRLLSPTSSYQQIIRRSLDGDRKKLEDTCREAGNTNFALLRFLLAYGAALLRRYDRLLKERHALDFNDLLFYADRILSEESYAQKVQNSFRYIHIDEVQDTTLIEYTIIKKIFGQSRLLLCGDYFQTIYQWRGSKPRDIFSEYIAEYHPIEIAFDCNYRSTKILLEASTAFLSRSFPRQAEELHADMVVSVAQDEGERIVYHRAETVAKEADWIYQKAKALPLPDLSKAAILCRNNAYCQHLSEEMENIRDETTPLSFLLVERTQFFQSPDIRDILSFLRLCLNRYDDSAVTRILLHYAKGMGRIQEIRKLIDKERMQAGLRLQDYLHPDTISFQDPYERLIRAYEEGNLVVFDVESTGVDTGSDEIIQIAAVKCSRKEGVYQRFEELLCPGKPVGDSVSVHHLTDEYLQKHGKDPKETLLSFTAFIKGCVVVGHNVGYDLAIYRSQISRLGLPFPDIEGDYDTLDIARRYLPQLPNHKLETLSSYFHTDVKSSHDAMDDVLATQELLFALLRTYLLSGASERKTLLFPYHRRFEKLALLLQELRRALFRNSLTELIDTIQEKAGILQKYQGDPHAKERFDELQEQAKEIEDVCACTQDAANELLRTCTLSATNLDRVLRLRPKIPILTVHQAKGAEFDYVFLAGLQEGQFPSCFSLRSGDLEEERRTFYVAMTRAKKQLFFSGSLYQDGRKNQPSRFISDIPDEYIQEE